MRLLRPEEYQRQIDAAFAETRAQTQQLLPQARIEHIGSTSIPGSLSKGDLDVCVLVPASEFEFTLQTLVAQGYVVKVGQLRTPQYCMLVSPRVDLDVALQVVETGSEFEDFLRFRDALRAQPELVVQYNRVKRSAESLNEDDYRSAKAAFVEEVLARKVQ